MDGHLHSVILALLIVIGSATICGFLAQALRLPVMVGFILSGIMIGPHGLGWVESTPGNKLITEIGVMLLLFSIGLELSFSAIRRYLHLILIAGGGQILLSVIAGAAACHYIFQLSGAQSLFWGALLSLSSTAIVMKLLVDARETRSTYGTATTGILLAQDMMVIPFTLAIPLLANRQSTTLQTIESETLLWGALTFLLISALLVGSAKYLVPYFLERLIKIRSRELFFFALISLCLGSAVIFEHLGLSLALGAFLSGLLISESPFSHQAHAEVGPIRDGCLAIFFASIGMLVDLNFVKQNLFVLLGATLAVLLGKILIAAATVKLTKVPWRSALVAGVMVCQLGEFSFVLAEVGIRHQLIDDQQFQYFLIIAVISMMITPILFRFAPSFILGPKSSRQNSDLLQIESKKQQTLIIGYGVAGQAVAKYLERNQRPYVIVEQNYNLVKPAQNDGIPIHFGDGTDPNILEGLGLRDSTLVVVCIAGIEATRMVCQNILKVKPNQEILVRVQYNLETDTLSETIPRSHIIDAESLSAAELIKRISHVEQSLFQES